MENIKKTPEILNYFQSFFHFYRGFASFLEISYIYVRLILMNLIHKLQ